MLDDGVEECRHPLTGLRRDAQDLLRGDAEHPLDLARHAIGLRGGQVDLVHRRHDREVVFQGQVAVGEGLGLDALRRVDEQHRALARGQAA